MYVYSTAVSPERRRHTTPSIELQAIEVGVSTAGVPDVFHPTYQR
jgi:hypothetical protein